MSLQTPLRRVLGLGSAKEGSGHWWAQRLTAVALVPLGLWFVFAVRGLEHGQHEIIRAWIAEPANSILLILLVLTLLYHSYLGLQVVIEDYVHGALKIATLVVVQFLHVLLAVGGIYAVMSTTAGVGA